MIVVSGRAEPAPFGRRRPRRRYAAPIAIASAGAWAGGVANAPFTPTNIAGLALWLRADLGVTIVQGPVVAAGTSPPAVTFSGTPSSSTNSIVLTCTGAGTNTTATFSWTLNGVAQTPFTAASTVALPGTGITATFPAGAYTNTPSADTYTSVVTVSAWADQSPGAHSVAQATATAQPSFSATGGPTGGPCITCNGSQTLTVASNLGLGATAFTLFAIHQFTVLTGARGSFTVGTAATGVGLIEDGGRCVFAQGGAVMVGQASTTNWEQWTAENFASGVTTLRSNGADQAITNSSSAFTSPGALTTVGGSTSTVNFIGSIAEVAVYSRALSLAEVSAVEAYYQSKYGI